MYKSGSDVIFQIAGLGFGDEGKGTMVDYFARLSKAGVVIRYNGGAQAGHTVVAPDGRVHTFSQFGSASFLPGTKTHLSRFVLINPFALLSEASRLREAGVSEPLERITVDEGCVVVSLYQQAANRLWEIYRAKGLHGSCGMGIGQATQDFLSFGRQVLLAGDLGNTSLCAEKLEFLRSRKLWELADIIPGLPNTPQVKRELEVLHDTGLSLVMAGDYAEFAKLVKVVPESFGRELLNASGSVVFEGAQGVLLDQDYGFYPYNTWTDTTFANADTLVLESGTQKQVRKIGVLRAYATRHGAGPFVTEEQTLVGHLPDDYNNFGPWQGNFRVGHFDAVAVRYALEVAGAVDELALTCLDRVEYFRETKVCTAYLDKFGGIIKKLPVFRPADLARQGSLTNSLLKSSPLYETISLKGGISGYLENLQKLLPAHIGTLSFGRKAEDKRPSSTLCRLAA